jgi:hypothetical protein
MKNKIQLFKAKKVKEKILTHLLKRIQEVLLVEEIKI